MDLEDVSGMNLMGEMAFVMGSFSVQGEYVMNSVEAMEIQFFRLLWSSKFFLTGEEKI